MQGRALERKLEAPGMPGIDSRAESAPGPPIRPDRQPGRRSSGRSPADANCWAALGYGGNGTTHLRIEDDIIRGALAGRPDVDADLYDFRRAKRQSIAIRKARPGLDPAVAAGFRKRSCSKKMMKWSLIQQS